jgi:thiamine-phosphate pyrophosphorylase
MIRPLPGLAPLYFVTDHNLNGGRSKLEVIASALQGGVRLMQYRDKELNDPAFEAEAHLALGLCRKYGATFLVNDRVAIAHRIGADGVHLGQEDMAPVEARRLLGSKSIIGLSTHNEAEVRVAQTQPIDYINIGPLFPTDTKQHAQALGLEEVLRLAGLNRLPWTTMGGIKRSHLFDLFRDGIKTVAMVTTISLADNVEQMTTAIVTEIAAAMV